MDWQPNAPDEGENVIITFEFNLDPYSRLGSGEERGIGSVIIKSSSDSGYQDVTFSFYDSDYVLLYQFTTPIYMAEQQEVGFILKTSEAFNAFFIYAYWIELEFVYKPEAPFSLNTV